MHLLCDTLQPAEPHDILSESDLPSEKPALTSLEHDQAALTEIVTYALRLGIVTPDDLSSKRSLLLQCGAVKEVAFQKLTRMTTKN